MADKKFSTLAADPNTTLTATAVGDYLLIYDISEPLDVRKIKVITIADALKLATETSRQPLVTDQAAGDLFYASAAGALARLAKPEVDSVLKNTSAGVPSWRTDSGTFLISEQILADVAATVTFPSIPATYSSLLLKITTRSDASAGTYKSMYFTVNDDGGANYDFYGVTAQGSSAAGATCVGLYSQTAIFPCYIPSNTVAAGISGVCEISIPHYKNTTFHKNFNMVGSTKIDNSSGNERYFSMTGHWRSTSAISKIVFTSDANFLTGSIFSLYGIV